MQQIGLKKADFQDLGRLPSDGRVMRWICQRSFLAFCLAVKPDFINTKFHALLADNLQRLFENVWNNSDQRMIIEVPPQIGKSTLASILFPAWVLGKTEWPVIVASYSMAHAEVKSQFCRDVVDSPAYQMIFPKTRLHPLTSAKDYWRTTTNGSYRAAGVGSPLTGMSGKLLICDDPFKDYADANSETMRENAQRWFNTVFYTRKQSKSGIILVNTRWHLDDLSGMLRSREKKAMSAGLAEGTFEKWVKMTFPAFAIEDEYLPDGTLFRKEGEVLCPERFSKEDMIKTREHMEVYEWSALYQQNPILSEYAEFKQPYFRYFDDGDIKDKALQIVTVVDLAISQKKSADNTVVRTVGKDRQTGKIYLLEESAGRFDLLQTADAIFHHALTWRSRVWIESVGYQAALPQFIVEEQRRRQQFFSVDELKQAKSTSKEARIRGLIPLYRAGMIFHRRSDDELERELLEFPYGKHDDRADALSMVLKVLDEAVLPQTPEQKERRIRQEVERFDATRSFTPI